MNTMRHTSCYAFLSRFSAVVVTVAAVFASLVTVFSSLAYAADPQPRQLNLAPPANEFAEMLKQFHDVYLLPVCFGISIFVLVLMLYTCWRFSEKRNPNPSTTTHNTALEVVWTVVPILILGVLLVPSMRVLYASDKALDYAFTVKIIGNQWYWGYEYPDHDGIAFDSYMLRDEDLKPGDKRLMTVDNPLVIPVNTPILLQFTANDVLHNWSVSEFGIRMDTIPGQLNEAPLYPVTQTGTYYGFCSELCGADHSFMPIMIEVVTDAEFQQWLEGAKQEFASAALQSPQTTIVQLAQAQ